MVYFQGFARENSSSCVQNFHIMAIEENTGAREDLHSVSTAAVTRTGIFCAKLKTL